MLGWVAQHSPGPRVVVTIEGTRSFGIGLARTLSAAGLARPSASVLESMMMTATC